MVNLASRAFFRSAMPPGPQAWMLPWRHGGTAQAYGVFLAARGIANRTVIVVGKEGKVAWIQATDSNVNLPDYDPVMVCSKD